MRFYPAENPDRRRGPLQLLLLRGQIPLPRPPGRAPQPVLIRGGELRHHTGEGEKTQVEITIGLHQGKFFYLFLFFPKKIDPDRNRLWAVYRHQHL